jgi:cytochrome P450
MTRVIMADHTSSFTPDTSALPQRLCSLDALPGPRALPLVGNLLSVRPDRFHLLLEQWARRYGPLLVYRLGRQRILLVSDPALARQVFRERPATFRRMSRLADVIAELLGPNVFSAEGAEWQGLRRLANESLSARHIRSAYPAIAKVTERLRARWARFAAEQRAVDVQLELTRFAVDVTTLLTLGVDLDTLEGRDDGLQSHLERVFPAILHRITAPFSYWRWLRLPRDRAVDRSLHALRDRLTRIVEESRQQVAASQRSAHGPRTFIDAMLQTPSPTGQPHATELIVANLLTMLLAGEDTTANTIAWALHHLCDDEAAYRALQREADDVLGTSRLLASVADAEKLTLAAAVTAEALRVRPVVAWHSYEALVDTELGGVLVPRGTAVQIVARPTTARSENAPEPLVFAPLTRAERSAGTGGTSFEFPFGDGPRICPRRYLAILEARIVLSMVARNFDIVRVGSASTVMERTRFTMVPDGVRMQLVARDGSSTRSGCSPSP